MRKRALILLTTSCPNASVFILIVVSIAPMDIKLANLTCIAKITTRTNPNFALNHIMRKSVVINRLLRQLLLSFMLGSGIAAFILTVIAAKSSPMSSGTIWALYFILIPPGYFLLRYLEPTKGLSMISTTRLNFFNGVDGIRKNKIFLNWYFAAVFFAPVILFLIVKFWR